MHDSENGTSLGNDQGTVGGSSDPAAKTEPAKKESWYGAEGSELDAKACRTIM